MKWSIGRKHFSKIPEIVERMNLLSCTECPQWSVRTWPLLCIIENYLRNAVSSSRARAFNIKSAIYRIGQFICCAERVNRPSFFLFFYVYHCGQTVVTTAQQENREKIKNNNNNHKKCTNVLIRIWPARCVKFSIPKHFLHCSSVVLWFLRGFQLVCPLTFSLVTFVVRRRSVERKMYADSPVDTSHSSVNEVNNSNLTHFQRTLFACRLSFGSLCGEFSGDDRAKNWDVAVACKEFERRPQTNILCIWICCFFISVHFIERVRDTFTLRINAFELAQRHKFQFYCFLTTYIHTSYMPPQHLKMHYEKLR